MWKAFRAIRFSVVGVCLVSIVVVMAGCTEALTPIAAVEHGNVTPDQMAAADAGDTPPVECITLYFFVPSENAEPGTFVSTWESPDSAIAADVNGNVYVAGHQISSTTANVEFFDGIRKFDGNGALLAKWDTSGSGDGKFRIANDMAVDSTGNIYIADQDLHGIQKLDANGNFVTKWGSHGSGNGQFWGSPSGLAVDSEGIVYATNLNHIQKFDANGTFLSKWNLSYDPYGVAVDIEGNVYTTDPADYKIHKHDANGALLATWGSKGSGDGQFEYGGPRDLAVDILGNVFVFDNRNYRIQKFDKDGHFIAKWGSVGRGDGQFGSGYHDGWDYGMSGGVTVGLGVVYVLDAKNHRVQKFCGGL